MVVATLILGVGIAGAATMMVRAAETTMSSAHRIAADDIGVGELERIRALPYDEVGISLADPGYVAAFDGGPTVTEVVANRVGTTAEVVRNGIEFRIVRHITWEPIDVEGTIVAQGFKRLAVVVSWTDDDGDHEIWFESAMFSGGSNG